MLINIQSDFSGFRSRNVFRHQYGQMIDKIIVTQQFISISKKAPQVLFMFVYYPCFL